MLSSVVVIALALIGAASSQARLPVPVLQRTEVRDDFNQFALTYTTGDGQARTAHGALKPTPDGDHVLVQQGTVQYTSPEGIPIFYSYVADENGYRAQGNAIPQDSAAAPVAV